MRITTRITSVQLRNCYRFPSLPDDGDGFRLPDGSFDEMAARQHIARMPLVSIDDHDNLATISLGCEIMRQIGSFARHCDERSRAEAAAATDEAARREAALHGARLDPANGPDRKLIRRADNPERCAFVRIATRMTCQGIIRILLTADMPWRSVGNISEGLRECVALYAKILAATREAMVALRPKLRIVLEDGGLAEGAFAKVASEQGGDVAGDGE